jgi:hypothetical protein
LRRKASRHQEQFGFATVTTVFVLTGVCVVMAPKTQKQKHTTTQVATKYGRPEHVRWSRSRGTGSGAEAHGDAAALGRRALGIDCGCIGGFAAGVGRGRTIARALVGGLEKTSGSTGDGGAEDATLEPAACQRGVHAAEWTGRPRTGHEGAPEAAQRRRRRRRRWTDLRHGS